MNDFIEFSIIIPLKSWSQDLGESLTYIGQLSFRSYEVILLPDEPLMLPEAYASMRIEIVPTGKVNPAVKRDIGAEKARGAFLAFIDDDAYPRSDWLDVAHRVFKEREDVGALGGPGITPKTDPFWARVSGAVFLSPTSGGFPERYTPCPPSRRVDDWPSVNLIVRKLAFDSVGGFDSNYWPGEDTLFCLKITRETDWGILYVPDLIVWHHRRPGLQKHLRQVGRYGLHRGYFVRKYPETSLRFKYFIPSVWLGFVLLGWIFVVILPKVGLLYLLGWLLYFAALVVSGLDIRKYEPSRVVLGAAPYIFLSHLWYGAKFVQGLFTAKLQSTLGR